MGKGLLSDTLAMLADELAAMPGTSMIGSSVSVPVPKGAEMVKAMREAAAALSAGAEPVAWPDRMVNLPCPDGSTDRILGFRIPEGDPILGEFGLSEPLAWLRRVTVERPQPATPASGWMPIESAPKDGTEVFVYVPGDSLYPTAAHYDTREYFEKEYGDPDYMEEGWRWAPGYPGDFHEEVIEPTHWQPLPAPPASTETDKQTAAEESRNV